MRCGCFRLELAKIRDDATPAFGLSRLAHITAMKYEPMMGMKDIVCRHGAFEPALDL